jgi:hypothetical protein
MPTGKNAGKRPARYSPLKKGHARRLLEIEPELAKVLKRFDLKLTTSGQIVKEAGTPLGPLCRAGVATPLGPNCKATAASLLVTKTAKKPARARKKPTVRR